MLILEKMKKLASVALLGTCVAALNGAYAMEDPLDAVTVRTKTKAGAGSGEDDALVGAFPLEIAGVKGVGGKADIAPHTVGFLGTRVLQDSDGRLFLASQLKVAGASMAVATPALGSGMSKELEARKMARSFASGGSLPGDTRTVEERNCDETLLYAYKDLVELQNSLNAFATGAIVSDLVKLAKAVRKLDATDDFIGQAIGLFPPLIKKVKSEAVALVESLSADIPTILEALGRVVQHCDIYIESRGDIATGVRLRNLADVELVELNLTHVSLEKVNITDINQMLRKVEQTLHCINKHNLKQKLGGIKVFLDNVHALEHPEDGKVRPLLFVHGSQIIDLSGMFVGDLAVVEFIDSKWVSPADARFEPFKNGVKYINLLIEKIKSYAEKAQQVANGTYLEALESDSLGGAGGRGPASSAALVARPSLELAAVGAAPVDAAMIKFMKGTAEARIPRDLQDLQNTMENIQKYLDS